MHMVQIYMHVVQNSKGTKEYCGRQVFLPCLQSSQFPSPEIPLLIVSYIFFWNQIFSFRNFFKLMFVRTESVDHLSQNQQCLRLRLQILTLGNSALKHWMAIYHSVVGKTSMSTCSYF